MRNTRRFGLFRAVALAAMALVAVIAVAAVATIATRSTDETYWLEPVVEPSKEVEPSQKPEPSKEAEPSKKPERSEIFVHCEQGQDSNPGTVDKPLRTANNATSRTNTAGITVRLARGCTWEGAVTIKGNGTKTAPIILASYGQGTAPKLTGASLAPRESVLHVTGEHVQVTDVRVSQASGTGVKFGGRHGTLADVEIDNVGIGVSFLAAFCVARRVNVHDLHMVVNTPGGTDDYGAIGFGIQTTDIEIAFSKCTNCRAPSHDFGFDGGFVEIWNHGDRLSVHDNEGQNTQGILEIGGAVANASARNVVLRHNDFRDSHGGIWIHTKGRFAVRTVSVLAEANTIVTMANSDPVVLGGDLKNLSLRNNVVSTSGLVAWNGQPGSHACNTYVVGAPNNVGYPLDASEMVVTGSAAGTVASLPAGCGTGQ